MMRIIFLALMLGSCAQKIIVPTEYYSNFEVRAYKMAMAHVQRQWPDFGFQPIPIDSVVIFAVHQHDIRKYCGKDWNGCYFPMHSAIFYARGDQQTLIHEFVHYIMLWNGHPEMMTYHFPLPWHYENHLALDDMRH